MFLHVASAVILLLQTASAQTDPYSAWYTPQTVNCPSNVTWVRRTNNSLSAKERAWVAGRKEVVLDAFETYLSHLNFTDFDVQKYIVAIANDTANVPNLALAISGGGFQSGFTGTGFMRAIDNRLPAANAQRTGGLLQSLTYIAGLSGGSYPVISFATFDFPTADEIVPYWKPEIDTFDRGNTTQYFGSIFSDIGAKAEAGFNVRATDLFARAYGYEFLPGGYGGVNTTWSGVQNLTKFKTHRMPFPMVLGIEISNNTSTDFPQVGLRYPTSNATIFEFNPFESGAWQGSVTGFTPTEWLGNYVYNGSLVNSSSCTRGFDQAGFIMATSADALNAWYIQDYSNDTFQPFAKRHTDLMAETREKSSKIHRRQQYTPQNFPDEFPWAELTGLTMPFEQYFNLTLSQLAYSVYPNPFMGSFPQQQSPWLKLADGSLGGQTIPLWGLLQPARKVDVIMAWDASSDAHPYSWDNGTNLYNTYLAASAAGIPFPRIPDGRTFVAYNWTNTPVFFGCPAASSYNNATNATATLSSNNTAGPMVVYLANTPWSAYTNFSFVQGNTTREQMRNIFTNSFNIATQGNGTLGQNTAIFPECLGCVAIERSLQRLGMARPSICNTCFKNYCWNGTVVNSNVSVGIVDARPKLFPNLLYANASNDA